MSAKKLPRNGSATEEHFTFNPHFRFELHLRVPGMFVRINIHPGLNAMKAPPEDDTQWVTNKTSHFSYRSTAL